MSNQKQLVLLNIIAITFFVFCWIMLGFELSDRAMFLAADANDYLSVANWMFSGGETASTITRPILYPALIGLPFKMFGVAGIWVLHFVCWLITINLTFLSAKKWTNNQLVGWISAGVVMLNLSLISLTFQGLTELVTTALLAWFAFHVISNLHQLDRSRFGVKLLAILVLLTLTKPSFYYPTLFCLGFILFAYRKQYLIEPKKIIYPLLVMLPILLQMSLVHARHGSFTVSKIGGLTFTNYYFSQCVRDIEGIEDTQKSIDFSTKMNSDEKLDYIMDHKVVFAVQFVENIVLNIKSDPAFFDAEFSTQPKAAYVYMRFYNTMSLVLHFFGSTFLVVYFLFAFFKKDRQIWIPLFCIGGISSYYLFTTGLSFWQGDRLVLPSIALWVPLYASLFYMVGLKLRAKKIPDVSI